MAAPRKIRPAEGMEGFKMKFSEFVTEAKGDVMSLVATAYHGTRIVASGGVECGDDIEFLSKGFDMGERIFTGSSLLFPYYGIEWKFAPRIAPTVGAKIVNKMGAEIATIAAVDEYAGNGRYAVRAKPSKGVDFPKTLNGLIGMTIYVEWPGGPEIDDGWHHDPWPLS